MNEKDRIEVDRSTQVNSRKKRKKWYNVLKTKTRFIKVPENVDEETLSAQVNEEIEKKHRISGSGLLKGAVATGMLFGGAAMQNMTAYANENDSTSENITEDDHDDTSSSDATDSDTSSSESDASDSEGSSDASSDDSDEETVEVESEVEVEAADSEPDTETREAETSDDTDKGGTEDVGQPTEEQSDGEDEVTDSSSDSNASGETTDTTPVADTTDTSSDANADTTGESQDTSASETNDTPAAENTDDNEAKVGPGFENVEPTQEETPADETKPETPVDETKPAEETPAAVTEESTSAITSEENAETTSEADSTALSESETLEQPAANPTVDENALSVAEKEQTATTETLTFDTNELLNMGFSAKEASFLEESKVEASTTFTEGTTITYSTTVNGKEITVSGNVDETTTADTIYNNFLKEVKEAIGYVDVQELNDRFVKDVLHDKGHVDEDGSIDGLTKDKDLDGIISDAEKVINTYESYRWWKDNGDIVLTLTFSFMVRKKRKPRIFVTPYHNEADIARILYDTRLIIDIRDNPDQYIQIAGISAGIPQVNYRNTRYIEHKKNGYMISNIAQLSDALEYYLVGLQHWNEALVYMVQTIEAYDSGSLVKQWKELIGA